MSDARKQFDDTTKFMQTSLDLLKQFLQLLADQIELNSRYAPQREMAKWIKNDGQVVAYPIQGNCIDELRRSMTEKGIPYIDTLDNTKIIIKAPDVEMVTELNKQVLAAKGNYFQEVDAQVMENAIAKSSAVKDKEILTVHGLDKYQCEVLKNKCNNITKGFMVGTVKEDEEHYALSIHAPRTISRDPEKTDFCKAYAEMTFSLYGNNAELKVAQVDADERIDKQVASLKGCESSHFVIGVDDPTKYIELNSQGFEFHRIRMIDGKLQNLQENFISKNSPDYEVELQKYMDTIYNKTVLDDEQKLFEHLDTKKRNFETSRPEKDEVQMKISAMEKNVIDTTDRMIKTGPLAEKLFKMSPREAFETYQKETMNIFYAVMEGHDLQGYGHEDFEAIKSYFKEAEIEPSEYSLTVDALKKYDIESHRAEIKDIRKEKAKKVNTQETKKERENTQDGYSDRERA